MTTHPAPPALDDAVAGWFKSYGLSVDARHYEFDRMFYAWRHYGEKKSLTLWVSVIASEDYEPTAILDILEDFDPQSLMSEFRHAHLHVKASDTVLSAYRLDHYDPTWRPSINE